MSAYSRAIALEPAHGIAYNNLAALLLQQRRPIPSRVQAEALRLYLIAHRLRPEQYERHPQMHLNLAGVLVDAGRYDEAIWHYGRGLRYKPHAEDTLGRLLHLSQRVCDWRAVDRLWTHVRHPLERLRRRRPFWSSSRAGPRPALSPMHALTLPLSARTLLELAMAHSAAIQAEAGDALGGDGGDGNEGDDAPRSVRRLRVGFVSSDFKRHPVAILLAPALAALHDSGAPVEITLFALNAMAGNSTSHGARIAPATAPSSVPAASDDAGWDDAAWADRLRRAAHAVEPLHLLDDAAAVQRIRRRRIDVLLHLGELLLLALALTLVLHPRTHPLPNTGASRP